MGDSESVLGLTLAELAFFLLSVTILLVFVGQQVEERPPGPTTEEHEELKSELASEKAKSVEAEREIEQLKADLENKRSGQVPTCKEIGLIDGSLFAAVVFGGDSYRLSSVVDSAVVDLQQVGVDFQRVQEVYSAQLDEAEARGCNHTINVYVDSNVPTQEYLRGMQRLRQLGYATPAGVYTSPAGVSQRR